MILNAMRSQTESQHSVSHTYSDIWEYFWLAGHDSGSTVQDGLELAQLELWQTWKDGIAIIQVTAVQNCGAADRTKI